jgi:phytoene synthase
VSVAACAALVAKGDPDRFAAAMAAPVAAREVLFPLYAFNLELARAASASREPIISEIRVQWWADALAGLEPGPQLAGSVGSAGLGQAGAHEVAAPLAALIARGKTPVDVLQRLVEARRRDVWREPFADMAAISDYLEDTGAGLMWAAASALGAPGAAEAPVRALGWAAAAVAYLQALPEIAARGLAPVPQGDIAGLARAAQLRLHEARAGRRRIAAGGAATLAAWQTGPLLAQIMRAAQSGVELTPANLAQGLNLSEFLPDTALPGAVLPGMVPESRKPRPGSRLYWPDMARFPD